MRSHCIRHAVACSIVCFKCRRSSPRPVASLGTCAEMGGSQAASSERVGRTVAKTSASRGRTFTPQITWAVRNKWEYTAVSVMGGELAEAIPAQRRTAPVGSGLPRGASRAFERRSPGGRLVRSVTLRAYRLCLTGRCGRRASSRRQTSDWLFRRCLRQSLPARCRTPLR